MMPVTKLITVMTYHKEILPKNLHDPLMRRLCEVSWKIKYIIPPSAKSPQTPNKTMY